MGHGHHHHHHRGGGGGGRGGNGLFTGLLVGYALSSATRSSTTTTTYRPYGTVAETGYAVPQQHAQHVPVQKKKSYMCCYLIGPFFIVAYVVLVAIFAPHTERISTIVGPSVTRPLSVSSLWYHDLESTRVTLIEDDKNYGTSTDVIMMKFSTEPPRTQSDVWSASTYAILQSNSDYEYWPVYMLRGSTITITFNTGNYNRVLVSVIRSVKGYNNWKDDNSDWDDYLVRGMEGSSGTLTVSIPDDELYYVIIENRSYSTTVVTATFSFYAILYDVSRPATDCTAPCDLSNTDGVIILTTPRVANFVNNTGHAAYSEFHLDIIHHSRVWFYAVVMWVAPLVVLLSLTAICWVHAGRMKKRDRERSEVTTPILSADTPYVPATPVAYQQHYQQPPQQPYSQPQQPPQQPYSQPQQPPQQPYPQPQQAQAYPPPYAPYQEPPQPYAPQQPYSQPQQQHQQPYSQPQQPYSQPQQQYYEQQQQPYQGVGIDTYPTQPHT